MTTGGQRHPLWCVIQMVERVLITRDLDDDCQLSCTAAHPSRRSKAHSKADTPSIAARSRNSAVGPHQQLLQCCVHIGCMCGAAIGKCPCHLPRWRFTRISFIIVAVQLKRPASQQQDTRYASGSVRSRVSIAIHRCYTDVVPAASVAWNCMLLATKAGTAKLHTFVGSSKSCATRNLCTAASMAPNARRHACNSNGASSSVVEHIRTVS